MTYLFKKASALACITGLLVIFFSGIVMAGASCTYSLGFNANGFTHPVNNRNFIIQEEASYSWYFPATKKTIRQRAKRQMTASAHDCAAHWMSHVVKNAIFNISTELDDGAFLRCGAVHDSSLSYIIWTFPTQVTFDSLAIVHTQDQLQSLAQQAANQALVNDMKITLRNMCNESSSENVNVDLAFSNLSDSECHDIAPVSFVMRCSPKVLISLPIGVSQNILDLYRD